MPPLRTGSASMRAASHGLRIKAAEPAALREWKEGRKPDCLERKYQAGGGHSGMSVFVDFEAGHLEVGSLIDESAILCAQGRICFAIGTSNPPP